VVGLVHQLDTAALIDRQPPAALPLTGSS